AVQTEQITYIDEGERPGAVFGIDPLLGVDKQLARLRVTRAHVLLEAFDRVLQQGDYQPVFSLLRDTMPHRPEKLRREQDIGPEELSLTNQSISHCQPPPPKNCWFDGRMIGNIRCRAQIRWPGYCR